MQNSSQMYFTALGGNKCEVGFTPMASNSVRLVTSQRENVRLDTPASLASFCLLIAFITCFLIYCSFANPQAPFRKGGVCPSKPPHREA